MADLILLNGPPASGKSTLAERFVQEHPMALNLDVDVIRGLIGRWADDPEAAGLAGRSLALSMARTHLVAEHGVIVPQFLGRPDFIEQLAAVATESGARFVEAALWLERPEAVAAFAERGAAPANQAHRDAITLVDRSHQADPVGAMYEAFTELVAARPQTVLVKVVRDDLDTTYQRFCEALT